MDKVWLIELKKSSKKLSNSSALDRLISALKKIPGVQSVEILQHTGALQVCGKQSDIVGVLACIEQL